MGAFEGERGHLALDDARVGAMAPGEQVTGRDVGEQARVEEGEGVGGDHLERGDGVGDDAQGLKALSPRLPCWRPKAAALARVSGASSTVPSSAIRRRP